MSDLVHGLRRLKWHGRRVLGREYRPEPRLQLPTERHGTQYGGWDLWCEPLGPDSVVWSFGIGRDLSFDLSLIDRFGVRLHAFDPTPEAVEFATRRALPSRLTFHPWGVAPRDGLARFRPLFRDAARVRYSHDYSLSEAPPDPRDVTLPVRRLSTLAAELGVDRVSVLKMDVEGAEFEVLDDLLTEGPAVDQLLVEFHHFWDGSIDRTQAMLGKLADAGFRLYHVSETGRECALLHEDALEASRRVPRAATVRQALGDDATLS